MKIIVLFHTKMRFLLIFLLLIRHFFFCLFLLWCKFFRCLSLPTLLLCITYADLLRAGPNAIRWVAHYCVKEPSSWSLLNRWIWAIHDEDLRHRHFIVVKICENVVFGNLIQSFHLVFCLSSYSIPFKHSNVKVSSEAKTVEILAGHDDATSTCERVINEITWLHLALVRHQESQLMIGGGRP